MVSHHIAKELLLLARYLSEVVFTLQHTSKDAAHPTPLFIDNACEHADDVSVHPLSNDENDYREFIT